MCGICGVINYNSADNKITEDIIVSMRDAMVHRGPDDAGLYISKDQTIGLGHRRLSIIDIQSGHQPICNEDETIWIVYNGEIYNYQKIRSRTKTMGHTYKTNSDTETIIHLYEDMGEDCLLELKGMYAFALWDERKKKMLLARDKIGIKPLYYAEKDGQLIFASEIKALLRHPALSKAINYEALYHYLTFSVTPAPLTLFEGINKLAPGSNLICDVNKGTIKQQSYWSLAAVRKDTRKYNEEYYIQRIRELLRASIKAMMMSEVPFGVFLSGGIDSSLNVALMSELMDRPVRTFSVGIRGDTPHNEFEYARRIALDFKTEHHEVIIDDKDFINLLEGDIAFFQDEPIADPVCVPLYYLSKLTRDNNTIVIQVGEGSDELFCGYTNYRLVLDFYRRYWVYYEGLPGFIKKASKRLFSSFLDDEKRDYLDRAADGRELFWGGAIAFWENQKKRLLSSRYLFYERHPDSYEVIMSHYEEYRQHNRNSSFLDKVIYLDLKMRLPELLLMRVDKMTMAHSVEARVPYLDEEVVAFAMGIPDSLKCHNGTTKYILKKAARGILPDYVIEREKMGFCGSSTNMLTTPILDYAEDKILNSSFAHSLFQKEYLVFLFKEHRQLKRDNSFKIWNLLNLVVWHKKWFMG